MNDKTAVNKKIKSCSEHLTVKMERGNNLRITCSTTTFEGIKTIIVNKIQHSKNLIYIQNKDQQERVLSDIIKVTEEGIKGNRAIFTVNMYRTKSSFLINGSQVQKFINEILPSIQSWEEENKREIKIEDKKIEEKLKELTMVKYEQHEPNINNNTNIKENNEEKRRRNNEKTKQKAKQA